MSNNERNRARMNKSPCVTVYKIDRKFYKTRKAVADVLGVGVMTVNNYLNKTYSHKVHVVSKTEILREEWGIIFGE